MENDIRQIVEDSGRTLEVVKLVCPDKLLCWDKSGAVKGGWTGMGGGHTELMRLVKLEDIDLDLLKSMKVWPMLTDEVKFKMEHKVVVEKQEVVNLMEKARAGRKKKYENVPSEIACTECHAMIQVIPSVIAGKVEKKGILLADFIAKYKCRECSGEKRGRPRKEK